MRIKGILHRTISLIIISISYLPVFSQQLEPEWFNVSPELNIDSSAPEQSPQANWPVLFNYGLPANANTPWGIETDGTYYYLSTPMASGFKFAQYDINGYWLQNFNIPGLVNASIRDLCFDGQYWWGIEYSSPCRIHKINFPNKTLLATYTLPTILTYGYHIAFDHDLYSGNGGFYLGSYNSLFKCNTYGSSLTQIQGFGGHYTYGCAIDKFSVPGTTILWIGDMATSPYELRGADVTNVGANTTTWPAAYSQPVPGTTSTLYTYTYGLSDHLYSNDYCNTQMLAICWSITPPYSMIAWGLGTNFSITTTNPANTNKLVGDTALFTTIITGTPPITCQWQSSSNGGLNWTNLINTGSYSGVSTPTLKVICTTMGLDQTLYRCIVTSTSNGCYTITTAALLSLATPSLNGTVSYANSLSSPIPYCTVFLKQGTNIIAQTNCNILGQFTFSVFPIGTYNLDVDIILPWSGVNSADALAISKHVVGLVPLTGLALKAADVNQSFNVNAIDAQMVAKRTVGMITSFSAPDWVSSSPILTFTGPVTQTANIKVLFTGDVNGSYVP